MGGGGREGEMEEEGKLRRKGKDPQCLKCVDAHVDQGHREFPFGNSLESATSKIQAGNSREFLNFWRKILTVHKIFKFSYFLL